MSSSLYPNATMLPDGLWGWAQQFQSHSALIAVAITAALFFKVRLSGILAAWPFFTHRYDFIKSNFQKTKENDFSFKILDHSVTAVRGIDARRAFYDDKTFSFNQGYIILMGGAPRIGDIDVSNDGDDSVLFVRRLSIILRKERVSDIFPAMFDDIQGRMASWGKQGTMNPFNNIYDIVFQITIRLASCRELASDLPALTELQNHFEILEKSATPTALLFPWFPGPAKRATEASTKALFKMLWGYIEQRKESSASSSDSIDLMLGQGMSNEDIVQFVMNVIFSGVVNTGTNACWILLYISIHTHWKSSIHAEIHALLAQHTNSTEPLHKRLSAIPISLWEDATPALDLAIRETIRLIVNFTALRRHLPGAGEGSLKMPGGDGEVPNGGFLAYCMTDAHLNPNIYTDPEVFDPDRYGPGREEDKREPYGYLGWGVGRHPCAGMKMAKLELKMIVAMFVMGYEYDVVDSEGRISTRVPVPNYNEQQQARPKGEPYFIKFKRVVE